MWFDETYFNAEMWYLYSVRCVGKPVKLCKISENWVTIPYWSKKLWVTKVWDFFSCLQLFKHTVQSSTSLAGCRTWCPTDLQPLSCKALINKIKNKRKVVKFWEPHDLSSQARSHMETHTKLMIMLACLSFKQRIQSIVAFEWCTHMTTIIYSRHIIHTTC